MITCVKNQLRRLLPQNAFARGVSVLVGGTVSAQVLLVLAAPLLTRLYSPEDFGLLAIYTSSLALIGAISSLRYELAIPLPEDDGEAANVAVLCLLLVVISALLTGVLVFFWGSAIAAALGVPTLAGYLWLLPVGVLLAGFYSVFNYWAVRAKGFTTIAGTKLRQAVATLAIQLVAFKLGGIALLFGQVAGQGVGTTTLGLPALKSAGFKQVNWFSIKKVAGRYRRFPFISTWSGLVSTAGYQLLPLMFAALFTTAAAGFYALAHRILTLPASLIGEAVGSVFFSHAADARRDGTLGILYAKLQDKLIQIGLPPAAVIVISGPLLFTTVFGEEWRVAGEFAQWLAISIFAGFVVSPLSQVFAVTEKQQIGLLLQIVLFVARLAAIVVGAKMASLEMIVALFSGASLLGYSLYLYFMSKCIGVALMELLKSLVRSIIFTLVMMAPLIISYNFDSSFSIHYGLVLTFTIISVRYWSLFKEAL